MREFKFFQNNSIVFEFNNIYEETVIGLYKYCLHRDDISFIGYVYSFRIVPDRWETITIVNVRYESEGRLLFFDYDITSEGQTYRHVLTIEENIFETITS